MARKCASSESSIIQNAAKTLLANVRFASIDKPIKSIVVTSSVPNEGKSVVSVQLAEAVASSGKRVLLVECDMRKRSLAHLLGVHSPYGLYTVLVEQVQPSLAVAETRQANLYFLDAEPSIPNPADILSSKRFAGLLALLEEQFDYVILDTPPVGAFVDAAVLSSMADATVFVVRENFVRRGAMLSAFDQLRKAEANVIGVVSNCSFEDIAASSYYYEYYFKGVGDQGDDPAPAARPTAKPGEGKRFK